MAKAVKIKIKLESTAGTGSFYLAEKNPRTHPEKLTLKKYETTFYTNFISVFRADALYGILVARFRFEHRCNVGS